jgi:hypothetical protein
MSSPKSGATPPPDVVRAFISRINAHDNEGLVALMSSTYVFIDSLGEQFPYATARHGWKHYFAMVPDYWIHSDEFITDAEVVIILGRAGGTLALPDGRMLSENKWETPAAWRAVVRDGKVTEWRVYCDNEPIREKMRAHQMQG